MTAVGAVLTVLGGILFVVGIDRVSVLLDAVEGALLTRRIVLIAAYTLGLAAAAATLTAGEVLIIVGVSR